MKLDDEERGHLDALARDPQNLRALVELGALLYASGRRRAGRMALEEAVRRAPRDPQARVYLGNACVDAGELVPGRAHLEAALAEAPAWPQAHQGLAIALARAGNMSLARAHARAGFDGAPVRVAPYRGEGTPIRALLIASAIGGNVDVERILDDRVFERSVLLAEFYEPGMVVPPHDLTFNAVGDADRCGQALRGALALARAEGFVAFNDPRAIRQTARERNARRLRELPGVVVAHTLSCTRSALLAADALEMLAERGLRLPLLLRAPGYHAGQLFERVDRIGDLVEALKRLPNGRLLAMAFLDVAAPDGSVRKYRAMIVDGALHPLHLAIADHWKVHYFSAEMDRPERRAEEDAFLDDMPGIVGVRAMQALESVRLRLGLDYGGIDFALDASGNAVVFEANATMNVFPPAVGASDSQVRAVRRIEEATRRMLARRKASAMRAT